jgi:hypothetical protein
MLLIYTHFQIQCQQQLENQIESTSTNFENKVSCSGLSRHATHDAIDFQSIEEEDRPLQQFSKFKMFQEMLNACRHIQFGRKHEEPLAPGKTLQM